MSKTTWHHDCTKLGRGLTLGIGFACMHCGTTAAQELSASQAREDELRVKLEAADSALKHTLMERDAYMRGFDVEKQRAEAAEARIKASQEQEPFGFLELAGRGTPDFHFKCFRHGQMKPVYEKPFVQPELAELQREIETLQSALDAKVTICGDEQIGALKRENAELRKLLESKVPNWKSIIIDRLHSKVGVCMTCGQNKCQHVSNTTLPDTVQIDDVLWCINLDEHFFKEETQPKEPKQ